MPAAATVSAPVAAQFLFGGQTAQFERFVDILMNRLLDLMQFFLGIQKTARDRVLQQRLPVLLEIGDLFTGHGRGLLLFLLQNLPFVDQPVILVAGLFIRHERVDPPANGLHIRLLEDGLAELPGFLDHRLFFGRGLHNQ